MKKEVLLEIINELYNFELDKKNNEDYTTMEFVGYLNSKITDNDIPMRKIEGEQEPQIQELRKNSYSDTGILLTLMFGYAKTYIKKALQNSPIQTAFEFSFLITLLTHDSLTKTELINKQVMEKTSGVDVIKRLLTLGLIDEFADPNDKRSVRVAINQKGKTELEKILPQMAQVSKIIVGNLSPHEINTLTYLLKKLDFFHNEIFTNKKNWSLNQILEKAIN